MSAPVRLLLDVDTGVDDALALLLAARHPGAQIVGVTCVAGNVARDAVLDNTLRVLSLAGVTDVPVALGADRPLLGELQDASHVHGANGLAGIELPQPGLRPSGLHAVDLMRQVISDSPGDVVLLALAPLTNVALLLRMYPEVASGIDRIVVMGGAANSGNATAVAEFNTWHDPEAAAIVFGSGLPVTMYGLDVFYGPGVDDAGIARLEQAPDEAARLAGRLLRHMSRTTGDDARMPFPGAGCLGDAGALCAVLDPEGVATRSYPVTVSLAEGPTRGQTVVDQRTYADQAQLDGRTPGPSVDVAMEVDGERYVRLFLDTLAPDPT
jgi:pyrimidine-specific ribonucleoside hydrolase